MKAVGYSAPSNHVLPPTLYGIAAAAEAANPTDVFLYRHLLIGIAIDSNCVRTIAV